MKVYQNQMTMSIKFLLIAFNKEKSNQNDYSFFWWKRVGSSYAREFACFASRRIDSVWFSSTHKNFLIK